MFLEKLCNTPGPSGNEEQIRKLIIDEITPYVDELKCDRMGNIIAHKIGVGKKVVIDAYMDEVGLIITGFNEDGTLKFSTIGNVDEKSLCSKVVLISDKAIPGVIGIKPIHLQNGDEIKKQIKLEDLCIDVGAFSKEQSKEIINIGDYAVFSTKFSYFGQDIIKSKALDGRIGCVAIIQAFKDNYSCDLYGVFSVQKEIGYRGAIVAATELKADIVLVIEGSDTVTEIGSGPAISIFDKQNLYSSTINEAMINIAELNHIPYQKRTEDKGISDASAYFKSAKVPMVSKLSIPCKYCSSVISLASRKDYDNTVELLVKFLKTLH